MLSRHAPLSCAVEDKQIKTAQTLHFSSSACIQHFKAMLLQAVHRSRALLGVAQQCCTAVAAVRCSGTQLHSGATSAAQSHASSSSAEALPALSVHQQQHPKQHDATAWHSSSMRARSMHTSASPCGLVVSFPLAQTGEGISECELMQWFVKVRIWALCL